MLQSYWRHHKAHTKDIYNPSPWLAARSRTAQAAHELRPHSDNENRSHCARHSISAVQCRLECAHTQIATAENCRNGLYMGVRYNSIKTQSWPCCSEFPCIESIHETFAVIAIFLCPSFRPCAWVLKQLNACRRNFISGVCMKHCRAISILVMSTFQEARIELTDFLSSDMKKRPTPRCKSKIAAQWSRLFSVVSLRYKNLQVSRQFPSCSETVCLREPWVPRQEPFNLSLHCGCADGVCLRLQLASEVTEHVFGYFMTLYQLLSL
jgi:hypothetical protein